jgi:hypothetical protein
MLLGHAAQPPSHPTSVAEAVVWSYGFGYRHQSAEQDRVKLTVSLNTPNLMRSSGTPNQDLFGTLAQYVFVADPLRATLAQLSDWQSIADPAVVSTALDTFATLASQVAGAWDAHWPDPTALDEPIVLMDAAPAPSPTGVPPIAFDLVVTLKAEDGFYKRLTLERDQVGAGFGWPTIQCTLADGSVIELCPPGVCGPDKPCDCDPNAGPSDYLFPRDVSVPADSLLSWQFTYPGLHVAHYQNATASVSVDRNAALLTPSPPAPPTNPAFVYQTPASSYGAPVTPFISVTDTLPIGTWSSDPAAGPLPALFDTIFDGDPTNRTIMIGVRYGYELAPGNPPVETYLPVLQSPSVPYASDTQTKLTDAVDTWQTGTNPTATGGRWVFWIDMHSMIDTTLMRPVLQLKRLESPLAAQSG